MIGWQGIVQKKSAVKNYDIEPYERTDDIKVTWK
jgi:hypothetical protein